METFRVSNKWEQAYQAWHKRCEGRGGEVWVVTGEYRCRVDRQAGADEHKQASSKAETDKR